MNGSIKNLSFESDLFGYSVGQIETISLNSNQLAHKLEQATKENYKLLYWAVSPTDSIANQAASYNNGFLADKKVTYACQLSDSGLVQCSKNIVSYIGRSLTEPLISLALQAAEYSRFRVDSNFINNEAEKLYTMWIKNSLSGEIAQEVFVYCEADHEIGLITLGEKDGRCDISLLSVDQQFAGQGVGKKLMEAAFLYAKKKRYNTMQVVTQKENNRACRFYEKCGFMEESFVNVYHFWL